MSPIPSPVTPANDPATPTANTVAMRCADFATLTEALDYAARGVTGANFHTGGKLATALPYRVLREQAQLLARRLLARGLARGARVAIVAETSPEFLRFFFACQYAALIPVALPSTVNLGGHAAYVQKLRAMLQACDASAAMASDELVGFLREAADGLELALVGTPTVFDAVPAQKGALPTIGTEDTAYLQFTSGSTGAPKAVVITQRALLANARGAAIAGLKVRDDDRFVSWLPFYHDMGLVGCLLSVMAVQRSIDYLDTREFAMRPRRWLELISRQGATVTYSPPFGYELCAHRVRASDVASYDLSRWRVAGIGAEMIDADVAQRFSTLLAPAGFDARAFVPSYGMAEASLAISFAPLGRGIVVDRGVDTDENGKKAGSEHGFVRCGRALPEHELLVCNDAGQPLPEREIGHIRVRGPSIMSGYFRHPEASARALSPEGWLDTGDLGYLVDGEIVITGRHKDMIIIHGRNIWPQDLERIAESQPGLRLQDASAFSIPGADGAEQAVLVVQCHFTDTDERKTLVRHIRQQIYEELGIACEVELVPRHTLPRTSSGKLSRSATRSDYLARHTPAPQALASCGVPAA